MNVRVDIDNQRDSTHVSLYTFFSTLYRATYTAYVSVENRDGKFATQYNLLKRPRRNLLWSTLDFHRFLQKPDRDRRDGR